MSVFFEEINNFSDDELREEIALLDTISVTNIAKSIRDKAITKVFDATNSILTKIADTRLKFTGNTDLTSIMNEKRKQYKAFSRNQLIIEYKNRIVSKVSAITDVMHMSEDAISVAIADECGKLYKINENLTPFEKYDIICSRYLERYVKELHKILCLQKPDEAKITDEKIFDRISKLPIDCRIRLKNSLCVRECTQKEISSQLRGGMGRKLLSQLIEFIGTDVFDNAKIVSSITYDGLTELSKPERKVLAYVVFRISRVRGKNFRISDDLLPGYIMSNQRDIENKKEKEYILLCKEYEELKQHLSKCRSDYEKSVEEARRLAGSLNTLYLEKDDYKEKYNKSLEENNLAEKLMNTAEAEIKLYEENGGDTSHSSARYKVLKDDLTFRRKELKTTSKEFTHLNTEIKQYLAQIKDLENQTERLKKNQELLSKEIDSLEDEYSNISKKYEYAVDFEHYKLKTRWLTFFMDFVFEDSVIKNVVTQFNHSQILNIERALLELSKADDVLAYSDEKYKKADSNLNYMTFVPEEGILGLLVYSQPTDNSKKAFIAAVIKNDRKN